MGRDLFAFPEHLVAGRPQANPDVRVFDWRNYDMYAFLGAWESKTGIPAIAAPRGIPSDGLRFEPFLSEGLFGDMDGMSWLSVRELQAFDYDATFVGTFRIINEREDGCFLYEYDPAAATTMTSRRFLGPGFFEELDKLAASGADRIVFFTV